MADLVIPRGTYGQAIVFTWNDADGNAFNLTGYTVTLEVWEKGTPQNELLAGACSVTDAAAGVFTYTPADGDFNTIGEFYLRAKATKAGVVDRCKLYDLKIEEAP